MNDYLQAVLMILLTVVLYYGSKRLQDKYKNPFLNPALIASIGIIAVSYTHLTLPTNREE